MSSFAWVSFSATAEVQGSDGGSGGGSLDISIATGKASMVKGGTVETGELHSVFEPLR